MPEKIIEIFIDAREAVLLGDSRGLRLHLRVRFVRIGVRVELSHVLGGGHEALDVLVGELDLFCLLRSGRAEIKHSESQQRRERTQKPATRARDRKSVSNERHGMTSISMHRLHPTILAAA